MAWGNAPLDHVMRQDDGEYLWEWKNTMIAADSFVTMQGDIFYGGGKFTNDTVTYYNIIKNPEYTVRSPSLASHCFHFCVGSDLNITAKVVITAEMIIREQAAVK